MKAMTKQHNRKLGLIGAAMTPARMPSFVLQVMKSVGDDVESAMINCGYLEGAPFEWVTISLRFGIKDDDKPVYFRINKKYGDLPLAIELDTNELQLCDREALHRAFEVATLKALIHAGRKFNLSHEALQAKLNAL